MTILRNCCEHIVLGLDAQRAGFGLGDESGLIERVDPEFGFDGLAHVLAEILALALGQLGEAPSAALGHADGEHFVHDVLQCNMPVDSQS